MSKRITDVKRTDTMSEDEALIQEIRRQLPDGHYDDVHIERTEKDAFGLSRVWANSFGTGYRTFTEAETRIGEKLDAAAEEFHSRSSYQSNGSRSNFNR